MLARNRPKFGLVTWFPISLHTKENALRDQALSKLSPYQKSHNTTRGTTPGLIDPARGEAGGRIPFPAIKCGSGKPRGSRAPGKNRGGGNHQPKYKKDEGRESLQTYHTFGGNNAGQPTAGSLNGASSAGPRSLPSQAIIRRARSAPISHDRCTFLESNHAHTAAVDSNEYVLQTPRRMSFPGSIAEALANPNKYGGGNGQIVTADSSLDVPADLPTFISHLQRAAYENGKDTPANRDKAGSKFVNDSYIGPHQMAQNASGSSFTGKDGQKSSGDRLNSSSGVLSNHGHKDSPSRKRKSDVFKEDDQGPQSLEGFPNRKLRRSDQAAQEIVQQTSPTFRSHSAAPMRPKPVLPQMSQRSVSSQGLQPHPKSRQSYENELSSTDSVCEHTIDKNPSRKYVGGSARLGYSQEYAFNQPPNSIGLYPLLGHDPLFTMADLPNDWASCMDQAAAVVSYSDPTNYASHELSPTLTAGRSTNRSKTLDPCSTTSELQRDLHTPQPLYDTMMPPNQSNVNPKTKFSYSLGQQNSQEDINWTLGSNSFNSESGTKKIEPSLDDHTDGLNEAFPKFGHRLSSNVTNFTDIAYWGSENSTSYIYGLKADMNESPEARFSNVRANKIQNRNHDGMAHSSAGAQNLSVSIDQPQDVQGLAQDPLNEFFLDVDRYLQDLDPMNLLSQGEIAFDDPRNLPAWYM